ncbi:hypothetical protein [Phytoactinopolyspora halotolerans]|uniref:Uncharacterized protein n=1 Tax=Phytoactinopolyspora halotolerans TaxID=1981512 RepID=A0A6L9SAY8_9ACTN|nr:hypothetical protein [Phytoactinopolyspora halotolerans]NEE01160.1 hypothetical protein [Phytoactinopolyspora halotolerans]
MTTTTRALDIVPGAHVVMHDGDPDKVAEVVERLDECPNEGCTARAVRIRHLDTGQIETRHTSDVTVHGTRVDASLGDDLAVWVHFGTRPVITVVTGREDPPVAHTYNDCQARQLAEDLTLAADELDLYGANTHPVQRPHVTPGALVTLERCSDNQVARVVETVDTCPSQGCTAAAVRVQRVRGFDDWKGNLAIWHIDEAVLLRQRASTDYYVVDTVFTATPVIEMRLTTQRPRTFVFDGCRARRLANALTCAGDLARNHHNPPSDDQTRREQHQSY